MYSRWAARAKMFPGGWGDAGVFSRFDTRAIDPASVRPAAIAWRTVDDGRDDGVFEADPELPSEVRRAHVQRLHRPGNRRACVLLAGSREEGYGLRASIHRPLLAEGIDLLLLENPYYGRRRPPGASSANLPYVADQVRMNVATILEALALLGWAKDSYERVGVAGYSMGGHMAALVGALSAQPIAVAAFATGASPATIYTTGDLSRSVDWTALGGDVPRLAALFDHADLTRLPPPTAVRASQLVIMRHDRYVLARESERLAAHWSGAGRALADAGHVTGVLLARPLLRRAVRSAFDAL